MLGFKVAMLLYDFAFTILFRLFFVWWFLLFDYFECICEQERGALYK